MYFPSCIFNIVSVIGDVTLQFSFIMMNQKFIICVKLLIIKLFDELPKSLIFKILTQQLHKMK